MDDAAAIDALLEIGIDDWISLDDVIWVALRSEGPGDRQVRTIRLLEELFRGCFAVPGELGDTGFEAWPGSPESWIVSARLELERLSWNPMGAGFWLCLTARGETAARANSAR